MFHSAVSTWGRLELLGGGWTTGARVAAVGDDGGGDCVMRGVVLIQVAILSL